MRIPFFNKKIKPLQNQPLVVKKSPVTTTVVTPKTVAVRPVGTTTSNVAAAAKRLGRGMVSVRDIIAPSLVEVDFDNIRINNNYYRTLFVAGYPRYVSSNWLHPVLSFDHSLFISMFIYPTESKVILEDLKRKIAEMEATIQVDMKRGKAVDPSVQVALDDALSLQAQLAKGAERFYQFSLYITIPSESLEELNRLAKEVESTLGSLLIIPKHATLSQEDGFKSTLPMGEDKIDITRNMDTTSLATTFPFTTASLTANEGILYGINEHDGSLVIFDRFSLENSNSVVFGKSVASWENVLIRENNEIKVEKIGSLIEELINKNGITYKDEELEGVRNPHIEVYSYDKSLKGSWTKVSIAARKKFGRREKLYKVLTKSGRSITVTADHSLITLRNSRVRSIQGKAIKIGDLVPLARTLPEPTDTIENIIPKNHISSWPSNLPINIPLVSNLLILLGLTTSEGHLDNSILTIFNTDSIVLDYIEKAAKAIGATTTPYRNSRNNSIKGFTLRPFWYAKLFSSLGAGGKSGQKRVPPIIFSLRNAQVALYLRAYFEGDGTVSEKEVSCTSKSPELISDLAYLLLRFGITGRIRKTFKRATNANHTGDFYYNLVISGGKNLQSFAQNIGFLTAKKTQKLAILLGKKINTNVDTVPTIEPIMQKLYKQLYLGDDVKSPYNLSPLKRGVFSPSQDQLKLIITTIENRISQLRSLRQSIIFLNRLPNIDTLIKRAKNRHINKLLWKELGASWSLMKKKAVIPKTTTVLRAYKTITGETITLPEIKLVLYETFQEMGISLTKYNRSLWTTLVLEARRAGDTAYPTLLEAATLLKKRYRSLQLTIRHAEKELKHLRLLAQSDLFWDPIVNIEKIKHRERYVYDLTVDNEVFLAGNGGLFVHNSGGGKSFLVKLETMRHLMFGTEVFVIDPEGEYTEITKVLAGELIEFSFNSPIKINPFDLSGVYEEGENELGLKILSLHGLMRVIMGDVTPSEDALLDKALVLTFRQKGITPDPATQKNEPPLMEDLYKTLLGMEEENAKRLAERLEKFVKGSLAGIFNQKSNLDLKNPLTVFNIKELEAELRPIAMFIILDFIWTKIKRVVKKRLLVVDEAWYLMKHPDSATFLYSIAKRARKYYLGVTTITQDVEDFLSTDHGKAIITNSSLQILLKQSPAAIDKLAQVFYLSGGEKHYLLSANVGEGLFFAGPSHAAIQIIASPEEYQLATSKPQEILHEKPFVDSSGKSSFTPPGAGGV